MSRWDGGTVGRWDGGAVDSWSIGIVTAKASGTDDVAAGPRYNPAITLGALQLREWLPEHEFQQAIDTIELIASKTEDRIMYDQREKTQRDYLWAIHCARDEGIKIGIEQGIEQGMERGIEQGARAGKIQLLQQLLNLAPDSTASLLERSPEELDSMLSDLQQQLRLRG